MVRSRWKRTLVVTAAWAGLALSPELPCFAGTGDTPNTSGERIIVVQDPGAPAKQCRVLGSRTEPDGSVLLDVQNVETGEKMTLPDPQSMIRPPAGSKPLAAAGTAAASQPAPSTKSAGEKTATPPKRGWLSRMFLPDPPAESTTGPVKPPAKDETSPGTANAKRPRSTQPGQPATTASLAAGMTGPTLAPAPMSSQPVTPAAMASAPGLPTLPDPGLGSASQPPDRSFAPPATLAAASPAMAPVPATAPGRGISAVAAGHAKDDPLTTPDQFSRRSLDGWTPSEQPSAEAGSAPPTDLELAHGAAASEKQPPARKSWFSFTGEKKAVVPARPTTLASAAPAAPAPKPSVQTPADVVPGGVKSLPPSGLPTGMRSVVAAGDQPGGIRYIPVPMVTVPDVNRPPQPPPNPFDRSGAARANMSAGMLPYQMGPGVPAGGLPSNAFTPPPGPPPAPEVVAARQAEGNAFTPVLSGPGQLTSPAMPTTAVAQARPMYPVPPGAQAMMSSPAAPASAMGNEQSIVRAGYSPMPESGDRGASVTLLQSLLTNSVYPSEREWAADSLTEVDPGYRPQVLASLLKAAHEDPAATVRAACVRDAASLDTGDRVALCQQLESLRSDADSRVRAEVEAAITKLTARR